MAMNTERLLGLLQQGVSTADIARDMKCSLSDVREWTTILVRDRKITTQKIKTAAITRMHNLRFQDLKKQEAKPASKPVPVAERRPIEEILKDSGKKPVPAAPAKKPPVDVATKPRKADTEKAVAELKAFRTVAGIPSTDPLIKLSADLETGKATLTYEDGTVGEVSFNPDMVMGGEAPDPIDVPQFLDLNKVKSPSVESVVAAVNEDIKANDTVLEVSVFQDHPSDDEVKISFVKDKPFDPVAIEEAISEALPVFGGISGAMDHAHAILDDILEVPVQYRRVDINVDHKESSERNHNLFLHFKERFKDVQGELRLASTKIADMEREAENARGRTNKLLDHKNETISELRAVVATLERDKKLLEDKLEIRSATLKLVSDSNDSRMEIIAKLEGDNKRLEEERDEAREIWKTRTRPESWKPGPFEAFVTFDEPKQASLGDQVKLKSGGPVMTVKDVMAIRDLRIVTAVYANETGIYDVTADQSCFDLVTSHAGN